MKVLFDNNTDYDLDNNQIELIKKVIFEVLKLENFNENVEISLSIVTNSEIKDINKKYRNIGKETDVLSFPLIDFRSEHLNFEDKTIFLGDIVLSIEKAVSQANEYGHTLDREIAFLITHSMLHLLGYDHIDKNEEIIMFSKQEKILNKLDIKR